MTSEKNSSHLILKSAFLIVLLVVLALNILFPENIHEYRLYLFESRPRMDFSFEEMSDKWTESDLKTRFSELDIICHQDYSIGDMGDRSCYSDIERYNDVPAMLVVFFFKGGQLEAASIHLPWWAYSKMAHSLLEEYGEPVAAQAKPINGVRLVGWRLANGGGLFYNRDRTVNPVGWDAMLWASPRRCAHQGCFHSEEPKILRPQYADSSALKPGH